jgi:hypothetical protein
MKLISQDNSIRYYLFCQYFTFFILNSAHPSTSNLSGQHNQQHNESSEAMLSNDEEKVSFFVESIFSLLSFLPIIHYNIN